MIVKYDVEWYNSLKKPSFQPDSSVFGPVWTVLYIMMFVSLWFIIATPFSWVHVIAYLLFISQLILNLCWTPVFFKDHDLLKAFLLCLLLAFLVFVTMVVFFFISKLASLLLVPYFLWCCFAGILSFEIWEMNSD